MFSSRLLDGEAQRKLCEMYESGEWTQIKLAFHFGCSKELIFNVIKAHKVKKRKKSYADRLKRQRELRKHRYKHDPEYREKVRATSRLRARKEDPEKRRARMKRRYAENPEYRESILKYSRRRTAEQKAQATEKAQA